MELLHELLLTVAVSLVLAFFLAKLVSIASPSDGQERYYAERVVSEADLGLKRTEAAATGGETILIGETQEGSSKVETVSEICGQVLDEGRGMGDARGYSQIETNEGSRGEEMVDVEEEEAVMVEGVERSEVVGASELDLTKVKDEEKRSEVNNWRLEEELVKEISEPAEIRKVEEVNIIVGQETGKIDMEMIKGEETSAKGGVDEVKAVQSFEGETTENVGLEGGVGLLDNSGLDEKKGAMHNEDDDWEGIERSDLEKLFGVATTFAGSDGGNALSKLGSDVHMQLYGLHKVATEGPCYESQPLALKVSARAKWHAWQRLGNMNPEVAMEQYITLLSDSIPGWKGDELRVDSKQEEGSDSPEAGISGAGSPVLSSLSHNQLILETERKPEDDSCVNKKSYATVVPEHPEQGLPMMGSSSCTSVQPQ